MSPYDVDAALKSGATEDQVLQFLSSKTPKFNLDAAMKSGAKKRQIIDFLATAPPPINIAKTPGYFRETIKAPPKRNIPVLTQVVDAMEGAMQGIGSTALHSADMVSGWFGGKEKVLNDPEVRDGITPKSTAAKIGFGAEQIGEYFMPMGEEALAAKGASMGIKAISRIAADALKTGAVATAQSGDPAAGAKAGATAGAFSALGPLISGAMSKAGAKIQASTIRPRIMDVKDGFKWETIKGLNLKGNLEQSLGQVESKLSQLRNQRNALIKPGTANVNLDSVFNDVASEVSGHAQDLTYGHMGSNAQAQVQAVKDDISKLLGGNLNVDISKAENLKEFFGTLGAWSYGRGDPDSKVSELVANTMYSKVRAAIENSLGPQGAEVKALNKQMQDLIPVRHAMLARIPVEQRNRLFSLSDIAAMIPAIATGDVRMLGLEGLTRAQKSLRFGNLLSRSAPKAQKLASGAGKVAGSVIENRQEAKARLDSIQK